MNWLLYRAGVSSIDLLKTGSYKIIYWLGRDSFLLGFIMQKKKWFVILHSNQKFSAQPQHGNAWSDYQKNIMYSDWAEWNQINIFFILYISAHQKSWPCIWRIQVNKDTFSTFPMNSLLKYMTPSWKQVWFLILNLEAAFFIEIYFCPWSILTWITLIYLHALFCYRRRIWHQKLWLLCHAGFASRKVLCFLGSGHWLLHNPCRVRPKLQDQIGQKYWFYRPRSHWEARIRRS